MENICTFSEETNTISCPMRFKRTSIILGSALILLIIVGSGIYLYWSLSTKKQTLERELSGHMQTLATSHVTSISVWLEGLMLQGKRLTDSEIFRLYATSVSALEKDISALAISNPPKDSADIMSITTQQPLMAKMLDDFTTFSGFLSARAINSINIPFLSIPHNQPALSAEQKKLSREALTLSKPMYSALRKAPQGIVMDIFIPVQSLSGEKPIRSVAVCMFTVNATSQINELLAHGPERKQGERTLLVEKAADVFRQVSPWLPIPFKNFISAPPSLDTADMIFRKTHSLQVDADVYALSIKVPDLSWWIVEEIDIASATQGLQQNMFREVVISVLMTLISCLGLILLWWTIMERERRAIALEFKNMADENARQKHFMESINAAVPELIGLKDTTGKYTYVNQTFAKSVGRKSSEILGMDDEALFGFDTGRKLLESDNQALAEDGVISTKATIFLHSIRHIFQISKVPFRDANNERAGILCVYRDITSDAENEARAKKLVRQTTQALVKAVEMTDPYLAGHSALLKKLSLEIGTYLDLDPQEQETVEIAATLSQIGKLFVDKDLLTKPGKLTEKERLNMEQHVKYAATILEDIAFDLPIRETILQSNEFLDGSGYPNGLKGKEITLPARLLCVLNTFCALIQPRSYRSAMTIPQALDILAGSNQYDQQIVEMLKKQTTSLEKKGILPKPETA